MSVKMMTKHRNKVKCNFKLSLAEARSVKSTTNKKQVHTEAIQPAIKCITPDTSSRFFPEQPHTAIPVY